MRTLTTLLAMTLCATVSAASAEDGLRQAFLSPPDAARPGVYWYFMDGNLDREGMTADLEAMAAAGIGNLVFLEVNVGVPRGPVDFLSEEWQDLFVHAVREAERLGIEITLGAGPGWTGSGGPWVDPAQSMQHLVASSVDVAGPASFDDLLPVPAARRPFFGALPGDLNARREAYYEDVSVLAFPTPTSDQRVADIDEKALYYRAPFSSSPGVKPYLPAPATFPEAPAGAAIPASEIIDLTDRLQADGRLAWDVPEGDWTIMRFGVRNNGANTRPAPQPGLGFECDKMSAAALDAHFAEYASKLLGKVGERKPGAGWTMLHMDSWEMGAQNWTPGFREAFVRRRGYDPQPYFPAYTGRIVGSLEQTERFLWDLRLTAEELVIENHAQHLKDLGRKHGFGLSIEPYDMNPTADLALGAVADVPMCEFWSEGYGFTTAFSVMEASSLAHVLGHPIVSAEAFTANSGEAMRQFPGSMKNQGDWAFCAGISRFVYHTFAHQPLDGERPGMTMGPYGVHWHRNQSWWPMVDAYHRYVTRCSHLLRQGTAVADVLYLIPEGAPHVFQPPASAVTNTGMMPDRKGYNFDAVAPGTLMGKATVVDGRVAFPGGTTYRLLVLPRFDTMTPALLDTLAALVEQGATVVGNPPVKSPSLVDFPACDAEVRAKATALWGGLEPPDGTTTRPHGAGRVIWGKRLNDADASKALLPDRGTWIWYPEGSPAQSAAPGEVLFRHLFTVDDPAKLASARVEATADNEFAITLNATIIAEGDDFHTVTSADARSALRAGENELTIRALNLGPNANPAGLAALLRLVDREGTEQVIVSDDTWTCRRPDEQGWKAAKVLGPAGMGPWRLSHATPKSGPYPGYDVTAAVLDGMGIRPDFEAAGPVRYTHRCTADRDIYFVTNTTDATVEVDCTFRAVSSAPECWNPLDGLTRALRVFHRADEHTTIPMRFEAHQSFFVVFPTSPPPTEPTQADRNFTDLTTFATLRGSWTVTFDEAWGKPGTTEFATLEDWTQRPEPAIRYYSGIATYRQTFDLPEGLPFGPCYLDLGTVHDMARIRLNGQDLGTLWTAP